MRAVILAAGEGTRMAPLTAQRPKPVLPVVNQPLLGLTLRLLERAGVHQAAINAHHRSARLEETLGDGARFGVALRYSIEERLLGTAGGARRAAAGFDTTFFVVYGDDLLDVDLAGLVEQHRQTGALCTIGLFRPDDPTAVGLVRSDAAGRVESFVEKPAVAPPGPCWANAGVYVLEPALLAEISADEASDFGRDHFPRWCARGVVFAFPLEGLIQDIGTPAGYRAAHWAVLEGRAPRLSWSGTLTRRPAGHDPSADAVWLDEPVEISPEARVRGPALLGRGCVIRSGAEVGPRVSLGAHCRVGSGARVVDSVAWEDVDIGEAARIEGAVLGARARIGRGARIGRDVLVGEGAVVAPGAVLPDGARWP